MMKNEAIAPSKKARQTAFIAAFVAKKGSIAAACDEIGITRRTYRNWVAEEAFKQQFDDVQDNMLDNLEVALYDAALEDGELALKILERLRPEKWKPKKDDVGGGYPPGAVEVRVTYTN